MNPINEEHERFLKYQETLWTFHFMWLMAYLGLGMAVVGVFLCPSDLIQRILLFGGVGLSIGSMILHMVYLSWHPMPKDYK